MARAVHRKEQIYRRVAVTLDKRRVQASIAVVRGTPYIVLNTAVHVVLRVGLDHKKAGRFRRQVELFRVVLVRIRVHRLELNTRQILYVGLDRLGRARRRHSRLGLHGQRNGRLGRHALVV